MEISMPFLFCASGSACFRIGKASILFAQQVGKFEERVQRDDAAAPCGSAIALNSGRAYRLFALFRKEGLMKIHSSFNASTRSLCRAALIGALYFLLTMIFQPISFGAVQFRISEALMLLPVVTADAIPGLFVGCLLSNLLGGGIWFDVVLGSIATLLAGVFARKLRSRPLLSAAMPVVFNGAIVGPVVYFAYVHAAGTPTSWAVLWSTIGTVALGEAVVCYVLGLPLLRLMHRIPEKYLG